MELIARLIKFALPFMRAAQIAFERFDDNDIGLDDEIAKRLKQAIDLIVQYGNADASGQARGYDAILAYTETALATLNEIAQNELLSKADKLTQAVVVIGNLNNPLHVYQARFGKDAELLTQAKARAQQIYDAIEALEE